MPAFPKPGESTFLPPPAGAYPAICYRVIDLGTQASTYKGKAKTAHKILLTWELLCEERMQDNRPFSIGKSYTWSTHEKSTMRKDLEMWRGKAFVESDFGDGPGAFDIKRLLGAPCLLTVMHETKDGTTYANVAGITKLPKGMPVGQLENGTTFVWLSHDEFDRDAFSKLSEKLQDKIRLAPEYRTALTGEPPPEPEAPGHEPEFEDEIPF